MMREATMQKKLKEEMISSYLKTLCFFLLLVSVNASQAGVNILPSTGIEIVATPGVVANDSVLLKPSSDQTTALQYRLRTLRSDDQEIDKSRVKVKNRYTKGAQSLDRYRTFLSGQEKSNPVTSTVEFKPTWSDIPGIYISSLAANGNASDIPLKITIKPKSLFTLQLANFTIATSSLKAPIISEVNIVMGSNSPRWELYLVAENLKFQSGRNKIKNDRVFARVKDEQNPKTWKLLNKKTKFVSGIATSVVTIATLEFLVESERDDQAGDYLGNIKFLVRNFK